MENNINDLAYKTRLITLLDIYGGLLTDKYYHSLSLYLNEDWSLSEIAEYYKISRQAVHVSITKAGKRLETFEEELSIYTNRIEVKRMLKDLREDIKCKDLVAAEAKLQALLDKI